jgi:ATP diphosphatase
MNISKLLDIMTALRDPDSGCPWDREQSFATIAPYTIEEAYEVADAIERGAIDELPAELGDLLFQVVFHAQMGKETGAFDFEQVVEAIGNKLIRRHPHVFGSASVESPTAQTQSWERLKQTERAQAGQERVLDGIPLGLCGLTRARKLGSRAARVGFDWTDFNGAREKVEEELAELDGAIGSRAHERVAAEMGDVLFALVNLCRHLRLDPEQCLRGANRRVEDRVAESGKPWTQHEIDELEQYWQEAKEET